MINEKQAKKICCEDISKIYGYKEAFNDKTQTWCLHHCLGLVWSREQLIEMGLYYNQPAERLMFVTRNDHFRLHNITFVLDENARKKISKSKMGHIVNEETRKKISKAKKGSKCASKKVFQYTINGDFVRVWSSATEAEKQGFSRNHISLCCHGKLKSYKGFIWRFTDEPTFL